MFGGSCCFFWCFVGIETRGIVGKFDCICQVQLHLVSQYRASRASCAGLAEVALVETPKHLKIML